MHRQGAGLRRFGRLVLAAGAVLALTACDESGTAPNEPGQVTTLYPAAGSSDAAVSTSITVTFSRAITIPHDGATVLVLERGGQPVAARLERPDPHTLTLTPDDVLDPAVPYVAHLGAGIRDRDGHEVVPTSWQFTTGGAPLPSTSAGRMVAHVAALADDSMNGRGYWTADELKAALYISSEFSAYGLTPFRDGNWLQPFTRSDSRSSQNVIGVLAGEGGLKDEWVVVGGHYDHVGVRNGEIYNGADDNASGTAMVLELAQVLAQYARDGGFGARDRRSLMFIAFGAEEPGLLGSYYFCGSPPVPLATISAMINLDMVGRLRSDMLIVGGWATAPEWVGLFARYTSLAMVLSPGGGGNLGTDYRCFIDHQRPAVALYTGWHPDYHQPTDDVALINGPGMERVGNLALGLAVNVVVRRTGLTWPQGNN